MRFLLLKKILKNRIKNTKEKFNKQLLKINEQTDKPDTGEEPEKTAKWNISGFSPSAETSANGNDKFRELARHVLSRLIDYTSAIYVNIYLLNKVHQDKPYLELSASYRKSDEISGKDIIQIGEGLVGFCFSTSKSIVSDEIPEEGNSYTKSGLKKVYPSGLSFFPVIHSNNCIGVVEISSQKRIPQHVTEIIEKLLDSVASYVALEKVSNKLHHALEGYKGVTEQFLSRGEELNATGEKPERKKNDLLQVLENFKESENYLHRSLSGDYNIT